MAREDTFVATQALPGGGAQGAFLVKLSAADLDVGWTVPTSITPPPASGDTILYNTVLNQWVPASQAPAPAGARLRYAVASLSGTPDGTLLTAWADSSGNGFNLANGGGAARPTYLADPFGDLIPAVRFNGVATFLRVLGMAAVNSSEMTVFTVYSQVGPAASEPWGLGSAASISDSAAGHARGTVGAASFVCGAQANNLGGATAIGGGATALDSASSANSAGTNVRRAMAWKWTTRRGRWSVYPYVDGAVSEAFLAVAPPATNFTWTAAVLGAGNNAGGAPNLFSACDWSEFAVYIGTTLSDTVVKQELERLRGLYQCL